MVAAVMHTRRPKSAHHFMEIDMTQYANVERIRAEMAKSTRYELSLAGVRGMTQQYLLYAASDDVFFGPAEDSHRAERPKGITIPEAQELVAKIQRSEYARKHWPTFATSPRPVVDNDTSEIEQELMFRLTHRPGEKYGGAFTDGRPVIERRGPAKIHLADNGFAMQPSVVLHELGHVVEAYERGTSAGTTPHEGHGAAFARTNIELIREFMSPEKATELEQAFTYAGVKVAPASQSQPHRSLR